MRLIQLRQHGINQIRKQGNGMNKDLEKMSKEELVKLQKDVDQALRSVEDRRRREARQAAEEAVKQFGFSLEEIAGLPKSKGFKTPSPVRYRHPKNPKLTWTGRGRKPGWMVEQLAAGKSKEDFEVE